MAQGANKGKRKQTKIQEVKGNLNDAICDVCYYYLHLSSVGVNIALYFCFICNTYLCQDCFEGHESHIFINKGEKERLKKYVRDKMMIESKSERKKMLFREDVSVVDRVNVKNELDKSEEYDITGLCGLDDTRWVVCDNRNYCIKIFSIGSHILQRYLRFWSKPWGVTEIKVKREPTEQVVMSANVLAHIKVEELKPLKRFHSTIKTFFSVKQEPTKHGVMTTSNMSVINLAEQNTQCLLAVTIPEKRRILFINLTQNLAVITKSIKTMKDCYSIYFSEAKIFTVCRDDMYRRGYGRWFVSVMSTDGVPIKTINTDLHDSWFVPYLSVCPGRIYITDPENDKVVCMNDTGKVVSHKTIERSWPVGISVHPDTNHVYICARGRGHHKLYRFDSSLKSFESLFDLKSVNSKRPSALCLYRDRLYIGHGPWSTHANFVTVFRVL